MQQEENNLKDVITFLEEKPMIWIPVLTMLIIAAIVIPSVLSKSEWYISNQCEATWVKAKKQCKADGDPFYLCGGIDCKEYHVGDFDPQPITCYSAKSKISWVTDCESGNYFY